MLLTGEHDVLELIATGATLGESLDAICRAIDNETQLMSSVFVLDRSGERLMLMAGPHLAEVWKQAARSPTVTAAGACGTAVRRREQVVVEDLTVDPTYEPFQEQARAAGLRSVWSTPFFSRDRRVLGTFAVYGPVRGVPSQRDLDLVARATHLASIAVERCQAEERLRESERLLRVVLDVLPVSVAVLDTAGDVILANPATERLWSTVLPTGRERYAASKAWWHATGERIKPADWPSARATGNGETFVKALINIEAFDGARKIMETSAVPIRDGGDRITGAVVINEDVSDRMAAERERDDSFNQMRALTARLMRAQDDERRRIAQMLHETTAQDLAALKMQLTQLTRRAAAVLSDTDAAALAESVEVVEQSISGLRTLSYLLHPPFLDEAGLLSALRWYAAGFAERSGIQVDLDLPQTLQRLPQDVETTLFRVVQEGLLNIHHHAESPSAVIRLRCTNDRLTIEIEDRGHGIPAELITQLRAGSGAPGVGVAGMRERLQQLGGTLDIESSNRGTILRAEIPYPDAK